MNDKKAHEQIKEINRRRNLIGVGGYKDSRRKRCESHKKFCETMKDMEKESDERIMREADNE